MRKLASLFKTDNGCFNHRVLLPSRHVGSEPEFAGRIVCGGYIEAQPEDAIMVHGALLPKDMEWLSGRLLKGNDLVWACDDDYWNIPEWNPNYVVPSGRWIFEAPRRMADWIIASTEYLADRCRRRGNRVMVCPNLLDLSTYPCSLGHPQTVQYKSGPQKVRILWAGSQTHSEDMDVISRPLDVILEKYEGKIDVVFMGSHPPDEVLRKWLHHGVEVMPGVPMSEYGSMLARIAPHIFLAPLAPHEFNRSKSNIRPLDAFALSAAVVASDYGEYGSCIHNGVNGYKCVTEDDWIQALETLIENHSLRIRIGNAGRQSVESQYSWQNPDCREPWRHAFREILG